MYLRYLLLCVTKRVLLFIIGFLIAIPLAAVIAPLNGYWVYQNDWQYQYDTISLTAAGIIFLFGVIIMIFAYYGRDCN